MWVLWSMTLVAALAVAGASASEQIPDDFPRFQVPGREKPLDTLRRLFWLH